MRASLYLVGFAVSSMAGAGLVGMGCSSSSSTATNTDSGTPTTDDGGGTDSGGSSGGSSSGGMDAACTPAPINVETFDSGSDNWACLQKNCKTALTACAADCDCNSAIATALACTVSAADQMTKNACFNNVGTQSPTLGMGVLTCLVTEIQPSGHCPPPPTGDAGKDASTSDTGTAAETSTPADTGTAGDATGQ